MLKVSSPYSIEDFDLREILGKLHILKRNTLIVREGEERRRKEEGRERFRGEKGEEEGRNGGRPDGRDEEGMEGGREKRDEEKGG